MGGSRFGTSRFDGAGATPSRRSARRIDLFGLTHDVVQDNCSPPGTCVDFAGRLIPAVRWTGMPVTRPTSPAAVPGLATRRVAAELLEGVLHRGRPLDEQLDGRHALPGLAQLAERDRALARRIVATVLRRLGTLR